MARILIALAIIGLTMASMASDEKAKDLPEDLGAYCDEQGWYHDGVYCYLIDPANTGSMTWVDAMEFCEIASAAFPDAYLAEITNQAEQNFVQNIVSVLYGMDSSYQYFWLGGTDLAHEGTWRWEHSGTEFVYTAWHSGQPTGSTSENCLQFNAVHDSNYNTWWDRPCEETHYPICKVPLAP